MRGQAGTFEFGRLWLATALIGLANGAWATPITLTVGAGGFSTIQAAAGSETSGNSYIINVSPGTYTDDFPSFITGTTTVLNGNGATIDDTNNTGNANLGIVANQGTLTVNNLTIIGAHVAAGVGGDAAGVRDQGSTSLTVNNSIIENSQDGILTADPSSSEVIKITGTQFLNNGSGDGQSHALYVGASASLDVEGSTFCGTNNGHDIKSRALTTTVQGSTMYIGAAGGGCAATPGGVGVDLPDGGIAKLVNDSIIQGSTNSNGALVLVGGEALLPTSSLDITGTTLSGDDGASGHPSIGVNEISGCIAAVTGSGNTVSGLNTEINPAGCGSLGTVSAVDEPSPFWLLLTALGGAWWVAQRRPSGRAIKN